MIISMFISSKKDYDAYTTVLVDTETFYIRDADLDRVRLQLHQAFAACLPSPVPELQRQRLMLTKDDMPHHCRLGGVMFDLEEFTKRSKELKGKTIALAQVEGFESERMEWLQLAITFTDGTVLRITTGGRCTIEILG